MLLPGTTHDMIYCQNLHRRQRTFDIQVVVQRGVVRELIRLMICQYCDRIHQTSQERDFGTDWYAGPWSPHFPAIPLVKVYPLGRANHEMLGLFADMHEQGAESAMQDETILARLAENRDRITRERTAQGLRPDQYEMMGGGPSLMRLMLIGDDPLLHVPSLEDMEAAIAPFRRAVTGALRGFFLRPLAAAVRRLQPFPEGLAPAQEDALVAVENGVYDYLHENWYNTGWDGCWKFGERTISLGGDGSTERRRQPAVWGIKQCCGTRDYGGG